MKLRSVNTKFWDDSFIVDLSPNEKLLFLYLLTNPLTNTLGVYEITLKRISFDTGLKVETILKALEGFGRLKKVFYFPDKNMVILPNFIKNQSMNSNMEKGAINSYNELPNDLKPEEYRNPIESFESLSNALKAFGNININLTKDKSKNKTEIEQKPWRLNFENYLSECKENFRKFHTDENFIKEQEYLNPKVNVKLTLEKAFNNYWGTEAGWKHKKESRTVEIDWRKTIISAIALNKTYYTKEEQNERKA